MLKWCHVFKVPEVPKKVVPEKKVPPAPPKKVETPPISGTSSLIWKGYVEMFFYHITNSWMLMCWWMWMLMYYLSNICASFHEFLLLCSWIHSVFLCWSLIHTSFKPSLNLYLQWWCIFLKSLRYLREQFLRKKYLLLNQRKFLQLKVLIPLLLWISCTDYFFSSCSNIFQSVTADWQYHRLPLFNFL